MLIGDDRRRGSPQHPVLAAEVHVGLAAGAESGLGEGVWHSHPFAHF